MESIQFGTASSKTLAETDRLGYTHGIGPYDAIPAEGTVPDAAERDTDAREVWLRGLAERMTRCRRKNGYLGYMFMLADPAVLALGQKWLKEKQGQNPYGPPGDVERTVWELRMLNDKTLQQLERWVMGGEL